MSLIGRLVARLGIDCGLPAAGVPLAAQCGEPHPVLWYSAMCVLPFEHEGFHQSNCGIDTWRGDGSSVATVANDFPAGVESTPAPPAGLSFADSEPTATQSARDRHLGQVSTDLVSLLRTAGDEWGPLGVAKTAALLAEHHVVSGILDSPVGVSTAPPEASVPPTGLPMFKASELVLVAIEYIGLHEGWRRPDRTWECACTQKFASKFDLDAHVAELVVSAITAELTALAHDQPVCPHCGGRPWVVHCPNGVTQAMCQHHGFISTERK